MRWQAAADANRRDGAQDTAQCQCSERAGAQAEAECRATDGWAQQKTGGEREGAQAAAQARQASAAPVVRRRPLSQRSTNSWAAVTVSMLAAKARLRPCALMPPGRVAYPAKLDMSWPKLTVTMTAVRTHTAAKARSRKISRYLMRPTSRTGLAAGPFRAADPAQARISTAIRNETASARYTTTKVPGWLVLIRAAAASEPRPSPAFMDAWRTENTAERVRGPARLASSASWAGQPTATPNPVRPAAPNSSAGLRASARPAEPAAAMARPAMSARRGVHRSASAPPAGLPASDTRATVETTRPAAPSLR